MIMLFKKVLALLRKNSIARKLTTIHCLIQVVCFFAGEEGFVEGDHVKFVTASNDRCALQCELRTHFVHKTYRLIHFVFA